MFPCHSGRRLLTDELESGQEGVGTAEEVLLGSSLSVCWMAGGKVKKGFGHHLEFIEIYSLTYLDPRPPQNDSALTFESSRR